MLRVFEAFAGYGSQRMALRNLGIPHEVVGISEIVEDALLSYAAIHTNFLDERKSLQQINNDEMVDYLEEINVPLDYKTFQNRARKLKKEKLRDMYLANKLIKNYGDITKINPDKLPDFDLLTYSFPCQDISVAGYQKGLTSNSGTRSSLLWECCKIIETKRPKYLLMENVKNLVGSNHIHNFKKFIKYLENLGYHNYWSVLNAKNYGVPQNRERVFCISCLDSDFTFQFPLPIKLKKKLKDVLEPRVDERFYLKPNNVLKEPINQDISYCIDSNYWKGSSLNNFFDKHRRQLVTDIKNEEGFYKVRHLTPLETWRLMGVYDEDFQKAQQVVSKTSLYKQAGNSIVVPVLEAVFKKIFLPSIELKENDVEPNYQFQLF